MTSLDAMRLSDSQRAAILDTSPRVLVAAGAGSGKTSLLVAYFVHALVDDGVPPQDLVAVTFTRKAAAELAERVRKQLLELKRDDLSRALDLSTIGTIHSLCRRLLRRYALAVQVDPAFSVVEAEAAAILAAETGVMAWDLEVAEADDERLAVLATHAATLKDGLIPLYERLRAVGLESPQIQLPPVLSAHDVAAGLEAALEEALRGAADQPKKSKWLEKDLCGLRECLTHIEQGGGLPLRGQSRPSGDELRRTAEFFPSRRTPAMEAWFEPVREAVTAYRCRLAADIALPLAQAMNGLLARFHELYSAAKTERGVLDFPDLELKALELVRRHPDTGGGLFGPRARVMVDEFQDTNELQCGILERLGAANLLMVGDEKQSIYRFRGADVAVFKKREAALASGGGPGAAGAPPKGLHRLADNYRSSAGILGFVNKLFASPSFFDSDFTPLLHSRERDRDRQPAAVSVEVVVAERNSQHEQGLLAVHEAEARAVGMQVRRLMDEEGWQPRQIVVLTPALTYSSVLQSRLSGWGVDTYLVRGKGYYSQDEVSDVRALLRILVDPHDDLSLVTVLRSPLVGISDDGLYLLGRGAARDKTSLWEALQREGAPFVPESDRGALGSFRDAAALFRTRVGRPGIAGLIDDLLSELEYDLCVLGDTEGDRRFANIRKLMRLADEYEALHGPDVAGFTEVLESMDSLADSEGNAPTLSEGENVVRVMTIHQAKGLQFPVVVLTGLGSEPRVDGASSFAVGSDGRVGVFLKGTKRDNYEEHDLCVGPGVEIMQEAGEQERREDLRKLYVAMTRAEDRLLLIGAKPKKGELDDTRIGRVFTGLGLTGFPSPGETFRLDDPLAVVSCVEPPVGARRDAGLGHLSATGAGSPIDESVPVQADGTSGPADASRPAHVAGPEHPWPPAPATFLDPGCEAVLPRRLSFSALDQFRRCPRRFYLERVLGLRADDEVVASGPDRSGPEVGIAVDDDDVPDGVWLDEAEGGSGRGVGLLVHGLLERSALGGAVPEVGTLTQMAGDSEHARGLPPALLGRAVELTRAFWRSPVSSLPGVGSAPKETSFHFAQDGMVLSGVMDLVVRDGGSWVIVDYKTNALGTRTPVEVARGYELQAQVYSLAALHAGAEEVRMEFVFLERPETPVTFTHSRQDRSALEAAVGQVVGEIGECRFPAAAGPECGYCHLAGMCPESASQG